jgi:CubicO group peptidase (beta-lactamase class C family)
MNRKLVAVLVTAGLLALAAAAFLAPRPHRLGDTVAGDAALAARVASAAGDGAGYRGLAVAVVEGRRTTTATVGDTAGGPLFEIGSVTKALTGMLFADLVSEGVVRPTDTLGAALPQVRFADPATAAVTLEELATHRSGLPRLAVGNPLRSGWQTLRGGNPYAGEDVAALLDAAATAKVGPERGTVAYSNFGMALLGQALAARTGVPYPDLLAQRVLRPLGMTRTVIGDPPPAGLAAGARARGGAVDGWSAAGYAPAGTGPRSTAEDMARLLAGVLAGTAPGADATTPRFPAGDGRRIGYAWFTETSGDREIVWHNGGTGGFRSYVGFDRAAGRGVVVLGNTDRPVDHLGRRLLGAPALAEPAPHSLLAVVLTGLALLAAAYSLPAIALSPAGRAAWWRPAPDRLRILVAAPAAVFYLLAAHRFGAWLTVPPWAWALACGLAVGGAAACAVRWRDLPVIGAGRPWLRWSGLAFSALVEIVGLALVLALW